MDRQHPLDGLHFNDHTIIDEQIDPECTFNGKVTIADRDTDLPAHRQPTHLQLMAKAFLVH